MNQLTRSVCRLSLCMPLRVCWKIGKTAYACLSVGRHFCLHPCFVNHDVCVTLARRVRYLRTKDAHKQLARTSYVIVCVACLFRLVELRTSYAICVACLFRFIALRTSYVTCVACLFRLGLKERVMLHV